MSCYRRRLSLKQCMWFISLGGCLWGYPFSCTPGHPQCCGKDTGTAARQDESQWTQTGWERRGEMKSGGGMGWQTQFLALPTFPYCKWWRGGWPSICTTHTHTNLLCGVSLSWSTIFPSPSTSYPVAASETGLDAGSRQVKEAIFLQQVRQAAVEERANQLRWWGKRTILYLIGNQLPFPLCPWMKFFK